MHLPRKIFETLAFKGISITACIKIFYPKSVQVARSNATPLQPKMNAFYPKSISSSYNDSLKKTKLTQIAFIAFSRQIHKSKPVLTYMHQINEVL